MKTNKETKMNQEKNIFEKAENFIQENNERINALEEAFAGNPQGYPKMVQEVKELKATNKKWKEVLSYKGAI